MNSKPALEVLFPNRKIQTRSQQLSEKNSPAEVQAERSPMNSPPAFALRTLNSRPQVEASKNAILPVKKQEPTITSRPLFPLDTKDRNILPNNFAKEARKRPSSPPPLRTQAIMKAIMGNASTEPGNRLHSKYQPKAPSIETKQPAATVSAQQPKPTEDPFPKYFKSNQTQSQISEVIPEPVTDQKRTLMAFLRSATSQEASPPRNYPYLPQSNTPPPASDILSAQPASAAFLPSTPTLTGNTPVQQQPTPAVLAAHTAPTADPTENPSPADALGNPLPLDQEKQESHTEPRHQRQQAEDATGAQCAEWASHAQSQQSACAGQRQHRADTDPQPAGVLSPPAGGGFVPQTARLETGGHNTSDTGLGVATLGLSGAFGGALSAVGRWAGVNYNTRGFGVIQMQAPGNNKDKESVVARASVAIEEGAGISTEIDIGREREKAVPGERIIYINDALSGLHGPRLKAIAQELYRCRRSVYENNKRKLDDSGLHDYLEQKADEYMKWQYQNKYGALEANFTMTGSNNSQQLSFQKSNQARPSMQEAIASLRKVNMNIAKSHNKYASYYETPSMLGKRLPLISDTLSRL